MLDTYLKWFQSHERLILVAVVLTFGYFGLGKWLDKSAMDKAMQAAVAQQVAAVQHDADQKIAAAVAQQTALFEQEHLASEKQIASLVATVASRDVASTNKIKDVLDIKSVTDVLSDLAAAYPKINFDPTPVTGNNLEFPLPVVQQFTAAKIEGDTAKADLDNVQQELATAVYDGDQARTLVGSLQTQVTGLQTEIKDDSIASQKQIAAVKADARKSKMKWFKIGFVTGFASGFFAGHAR